MTCLSRMSEIVGLFDLFVFDQYGTLHDGLAVYRGARTVFAELHSAGKKIAIVSNSGRTGQENCARLSNLGFAVDGIPVITSGDCLQLWLKQRYPRRRPKAFVLGHSIESLASCEQTTEVEQAELVIFNGLAAGLTETEIIQQLNESLKKGIPLVCANPDEIALEGARSYRATGSFAREYQLRGGTVTFIGKPFPLIFDMLKIKFPDIDAARVICVGDSLEHDVKGAALAGIKSLWLLNGVHRSEFIGMAPNAKWRTVRKFLAGVNVQPDFVMEELAW